MKRARRDERFDTEEHRPLYARMLRLRHLAPSGFLCFVFLEGGVALGVLLALAELVSWWGVLVLPATVALMVKLNDVIAGSLARTPPPPRRPRTTRPTAGHSPELRPAAATGPAPAATAAPAGVGVGEGATTRLPRVMEQASGAPINRPWADRVEAQEQWARQAATRRYE